MEYHEKLKKIKAFAFDVDGVLSSGMIAMPDGEMLRIMDARDGYIIKKSLDMGIPVAIITRGNNKSVKVRFQRIGVTDYYDATTINSKTSALRDFAQKHGLELSEIMFCGDDIPDIGCLKLAGIGACPADACQDAKDAADFVSEKLGGHGFGRAMMEQALRCQGLWPITDED